MGIRKLDIENLDTVKIRKAHIQIPELFDVWKKSNGSTIRFPEKIVRTALCALKTGLKIEACLCLRPFDFKSIFRVFDYRTGLVQYLEVDWTICPIFEWVVQY
jgi:hypothetical protein